MEENWQHKIRHSDVVNQIRESIDSCEVGDTIIYIRIRPRENGTVAQGTFIANHDNVGTQTIHSTLMKLIGHDG